MTLDQNAMPDRDDAFAGTRDPVRGLAEQAYDAVLDLVVSQVLQAGDIVPERMLAQRIGVSRTPLREALRRLEGERVLERREAGKLFVRSVSVEDFMEVLHIRRMLEADAAARAAGRIPDAALDDLQRRLERLLSDGDPAAPEHQATDDDLHRLVAEAAGNRLAAEVIGDLRRRTRMFSMRRMPERFEPICREHLAIIAALRKDDGAAAAEAVAHHLDSVKDSIIRRLLGR